MPDFSALTDIGLNRGILSPADPIMPFCDIALMGRVGYVNSTTTWTQNRAVYSPVIVQRPITVTHILIQVVTQNGNVDVGIYDWGGTRLVSSGSTACAAAGLQSLDITDTLLKPGRYYLAFASDSNAVAVFQHSTIGVPIMRVCGFQQQSSAFVLPATATFANYATAVAPFIVATYRTTF